MARKMRELLWKLREDTANEILELQQCGEVSAWLEEPSEPNAAGAGKDLDTAAAVLQEEVSPREFSLKMH